MQITQITEIPKQELRKRALIVHLVVYIMVNALLLSINLMFTPNYLWFFYALAPWGIGLAVHLLLTFLMQGEEIKDKAAAAQKIFTVHLVFYLLINGFLAVINLRFTPELLWFIFPAMGWAIGIILHFIASFYWAVKYFDETNDQ